MPLISLKSLQKYGSIIDMETFSLIQRAILEGQKYITVPEYRLLDFEQRHKAYIDEIKMSNTCCKIREKARGLDKAGNIQEALSEHLKAFEIWNNSPKPNVLNFAFDIERIIILYGKLKQLDNQKQFLEDVINQFPSWRDADKWRIRLAKIGCSNSDKKPASIKKSDIRVRRANTPTIGKQTNVYKNSMPEFNFYYDMPEGMQTFEYLGAYKPVPFNQSVKLKTFRDEYDNLLNEAKIAESSNKLNEAIEIYEYLVSEEYEYTEPFERLMIIYKKLKWVDEEIIILEKAIRFFEKVRLLQKGYVLRIAKKYQSENRALEYINSKKKIQYFGGAFDLYNPYPQIANWRLKLNNR